VKGEGREDEMMSSVELRGKKDDLRPQRQRKRRTRRTADPDPEGVDRTAAADREEGPREL